MTGRRDALAATVRRAFASVGDLARPATLRRAVPGGYDPETGAPQAPPQEDACECRALADGAGRPRFALEGLELAPDEAAYWLAGCAFAPRPGDDLTIDGTTRSLRAVRNLLDADALWLVVAK